MDTKTGFGLLCFEDLAEMWSISENSIEFHGKIFPMSSDGWSFVVSDNDKKETTVYLENGEVYKISPTKSNVAKLFDGPQTCKNVTESSTKNKSGAGVIYALYSKAISDKKIPLDVRKKMVESCKVVSNSVIMPATGMMMGGIPASGMMVGGGSSLPTAKPASPPTDGESP